MKTKLGLLLFVLLCCGKANAQNAMGFAYFAPGAESPVGSTGGTRHAYGLGGGGELLFAPHFSGGAEIGALVPGQGKTANTVGIFSATGNVHLLRDKPFDPFLTAGYSMVFRDFTSNGVSFGGGMNYWFRENVGLRLEGRDTYAKLQGIPTHLWEIRIGFTFR
jgi:hypothetical protein